MYGITVHLKLKTEPLTMIGLEILGLIGLHLRSGRQSGGRIKYWRRSQELLA